MVIKKGEAWGAVHDGRSATSFENGYQLAQWVLATEAESPVGRIAAGDLITSLGGKRKDESWAFPMDLAVVEIEDSSFGFVSHLSINEPLGRGRAITIMNSTHIAGLNLGFRAHPNDGLLDKVESNLTWRESRQARHRAVSGSYLPHPKISYNRAAQFEVSLAKEAIIKCDGVEVGSTNAYSVSLLADAFTLVI